jgi:hypothetical protein
MAPDRQPDVSVDMLAQLRGALDHLNGIAARVPGVAQTAAHLPDFPTIPTPGKITAAQISAVVGAVRAQRSTMQALRNSLDAFDQQLEILEQLLEPLESVSGTWARIEGSVSGERTTSASDAATPGNSGA